MSVEKNESIQSPISGGFDREAIRARLKKSKENLADEANVPVRQEQEKQELHQQALGNLQQLLVFLHGFGEADYDQIKATDIPFDELLIQASILVHEDLPEFKSTDGRMVEDLQQELTEDILPLMDELDHTITQLGGKETQKDQLDVALKDKEDTQVYANLLKTSIADLWRQKTAKLIEWLNLGVKLEGEQIMPAGEYTKKLVETDSFKNEVVIEKQTYKSFQKAWIGSFQDNRFDHTNHEFSDLIFKRRNNGGDDELGTFLVNNICVSQAKEKRVGELQKKIQGVDVFLGLLQSTKKADYTSLSSHVSKCLRGAFGDDRYVNDFLHIDDFERTHFNSNASDAELLAPYQKKIEKAKQMCQQALEAIEIEKTAHDMFVKTQLAEIIKIIDGNQSFEDGEKREVLRNIGLILSGVQGRSQSDFHKVGGQDGKIVYECNNLYPLVPGDKSGDWLLPIYQKLNEISLYESICQGSGLTVDDRYGTNNGWVTDEILRFWTDAASNFDASRDNKNRVPSTGDKSEKLMVETQSTAPIKLSVNENVFLKAIGTVQLTMNKLAPLGMDEEIKTYLGRVANTINEHTAHKADFSDALFFNKREAEVRSLEVQGKIQEWQGLVIKEMQEAGKRPKESASIFIKNGKIVLSSLPEAKIILDENRRDALKNAIEADKEIAEKNLQILSLNMELEKLKQELICVNQLKDAKTAKVVEKDKEIKAQKQRVEELSADKYNLTEDLELKKSEIKRLNKKLNEINLLADEGVQNADKIDSLIGKEGKRNVVYRKTLGDVLGASKL